MTQSEESLFAQKEGILDNTEIKLLRSLVDILNERQILVERKRPPQPPSASKQSRVNSGKDAQFENDDDGDIVVVDGGDSDFELEKEGDLDEAVVSSSNATAGVVADDHDDDDDIEYGPVQSNRRANQIKSDYEADLDYEEEDNNIKTSRLSETESIEVVQLRQEIQLLDKFKTLYLLDYNLEESKYSKYFERVFLLIVNKRICNKNWTQSNNLSSKNVYSVLYCLRILLRSVHFQRKFLSMEGSFRSILKLLDKYVQLFSSLPNQVLVYAHILDQLLNILYKIFGSEILQADIEALRGNSGGQSRQSSAGSASTISSKSTKLVKRLSKLAFAYNMHINLMQLIENSHEMCLVQASLNLLVQLSTIDVENRSVLAANLDISSQLLIILQECEEDSKKQAAKLLCLLCIEDEIKSEVVRMDGIQVLLSLLHSQTNQEILWNVIWTLIQLCSSDENKREIRQMGGIPLILSIISEKSLLDSEMPAAESNDNKTNKSEETTERRLKAKLQVQAACCALVGELALNETNSYQIANTNGVYLIASKLLVPANLSTGSGLNDSQNSKISGEGSTRSRDVERLHSNAWRTLRLLFSTERHRPLIKKLIPTSLFEPFVDIGNYKKDLKLYQPLVESFYKLTNDEMNIMRQQIQSSNHSQAPKNIINDYEVYEILGSGAFGCVHKVRKKNTNIFLAMKEINTSLSLLKGQIEMVNEVTIIRNNLKHPNVVRYLKTFKENDRLYIVMELIDGTPLSQHLRKLKEKEDFWNEDRLWYIFMQIVLALRYLHKEKQIVHRDLTSNNIMLSESDKVTITDFGLAKILESDRSKMQSVVGTMFYSCPEIIKNEPYNEKADIWALGCILYEMCCFEPPFCTSNMLALITKITQADYDLDRVTRNARYSQLVSHVIQNCLVIDPNKRVDIVGVASLIADKMLVFADNFRFKCSSLEKKLEKEKNKTQMLYCNKLDLTNSQSRPANLDLDANENNQQFNQVPPVLNKPAANIANVDNTPQSPVHRCPSTPSSISIPETMRQQQESIIIESMTSSTSLSSKRLVDSTASYPQLNSPNAKLPPKQNPRSKIIMKNIQNKQMAQSSQQELTSSSVVSFQQQSSFDGSSSTSSQKYNVMKNGTAVDETQPTDNSVGIDGLSSRIQRSSSSSTLEKRPSQSKKSRPNSANSGIVPVYKKLRPVQDPIIQILDQIHKILFIAQLPPSGRKNFKRKLVDRYKRSLFSNKLGSSQIKSELMKLIKNSNELIDIEMIGLKNFQYCFNSSDCNSLTNKKSSNERVDNNGNLDATVSFNALNDFDLIAYQNGITYEQLQTIIEDLLTENHYYTERMKHLREELPSID